jgi:hypothetical protein
MKTLSAQTTNNGSSSVEKKAHTVYIMVIKYSNLILNSDLVFICNFITWHCAIWQSYKRIKIKRNLDSFFLFVNYKMKHWNFSLVVVTIKLGLKNPYHNVYLHIIVSNGTISTTNHRQINSNNLITKQFYILEYNAALSIKSQLMYQRDVSPPSSGLQNKTNKKPQNLWHEKKNKLHGLSLRENYTDRATAACRRSDCQLLRIEGATWSAWRIPLAVFSVF